MRRSENFVVVAGNVKSIKSGQTNSGSPAFSFWLAIDSGYKTVFVKVSAYGKLAEICASGKVQKGDFLVVVGELFNRTATDGKTYTEVKAHKILFSRKE